MAKILRPLLSLFDQPSGPAMTDLDRHARDLAEARKYLDPRLSNG